MLYLENWKFYKTLIIFILQIKNFRYAIDITPCTTSKLKSV